MSEQPANEAPFRLLRDVDFGENVLVYSFTNLYGCSIGDNSRVGAPSWRSSAVQRWVRTARSRAHVHLRRGSRSRTKSSSDTESSSSTTGGRGPATRAESCSMIPNGSSSTPSSNAAPPVGYGATILCGVRIGEGALVGAGAVVTKDVAPHTVVAGDPARLLLPAPPKRVRLPLLHFDGFKLTHLPSHFSAA